MEQRLSIVTLGVQNIVTATEFYQKLGWTPSSLSNSNITFFQIGGSILGLYPNEGLNDDIGLSEDGVKADGQFRGVTLVYCAKDKKEVNAVLVEAQKAGGKLLKEAQDVFWGGYSGYFCDPENHIWEVAYNPHFELKEDGSIVLPA